MDAIDHDMLDRSVGDDMELLRELAGIFAVDGPQLCTAITEAVLRNDSETLRRKAHTLQGCAGNLGGATVRNISKQLEELGAKGMASKGQELCNALVVEVERLQAALYSVSSPAAKGMLW